MADEYFLREASALLEQALGGPGLSEDMRTRIVRAKAKVDTLLAAAEEQRRPRKAAG